MQIKRKIQDGIQHRADITTVRTFHVCSETKRQESQTKKNTSRWQRKKPLTRSKLPTEDLMDRTRAVSWSS